MTTLKEAIIALIQAHIEQKKPCVHEWHLHNEKQLNYKQNPDFSWTEYIYVCKKCMDVKHVSTKFD